jgi:anti-sigma B factor antagonist
MTAPPPIRPGDTTPIHPAPGRLPDPESVVTVRDQGDWAILEVRGDLDVCSAPALRDALVGVVAEGRGRVVVDLSAVTFLDSAGLGTLVLEHRRVRAEGGWLRIVRSPGPVDELLELTGLDRALPLYASVAEAVA